MTMPLMKPRRKNPVLRTRQMNLPPFARGRTALGMTAAAAEGRFELQVCQRCSAVQYPPRDACHRCLSPQLKWTPQGGAGELISETVLHHSNDPFYRERLPWRLGLVRLDAGPTVIVHLHGDVASPPPVGAGERRAVQAGGARPCRRAPRPRRRRGADRISARGERTHGRRQDAARDDQRPQVQEDPRHRRQDRGRPGARQGARQGRRRDRLGRPRRAVEEAARASTTSPP